MLKKKTHMNVLNRIFILRMRLMQRTQNELQVKIWILEISGLLGQGRQSYGKSPRKVLQ